MTHISPQTPSARAEQVFFDALAALEARDGAADPFAAAALDIASMRVLDASNPTMTLVRQHALQQMLSAAI